MSESMNQNAMKQHNAVLSCRNLSKRYDEAEKSFRRAIELDPRLWEAHYFYGRDALAQGKMEKAASLLEGAQQVRPEDYQTPALLRQVYTGLGRAEDAGRTLKRALDVIDKHLELNPDDARALYLGAGSLVQMGQKQKGLEWLQRALASDPDDALILYNVACVNARAGEIEAALDCLEKSVARGMAEKSAEFREAGAEVYRQG